MAFSHSLRTPWRVIQRGFKFLHSAFESNFFHLAGQIGVLVPITNLRENTLLHFVLNQEPKFAIKLPLGLSADTGNDEILGL